MLVEVLDLAQQMVLGPRPEPGIGAVVAGAEVELDGQLQVMQPGVVFHQQVELAQGLAVVAHRQVGGEQAQIRRTLQGELPEAFVVASQTLVRRGFELGQQLARRVFLAAQPVGQQPGLRVPATGAERMAQGGAARLQQGRGEQRPGEVADLRLAQVDQQLVEQGGEVGHAPSLAAMPALRFAAA